MNTPALVKLKKAIDAYMGFYNHKRWHQSLNYKTPANVFYKSADRMEPIDICTSPTDQTAPSGCMDKLWITLTR